MLHGCAGILLLLFAASHVADLLIGDISHGSDNTVFPFLTNKIMYFVAAFLETITALLCFKFRGEDFVNILIMTFVGLIVWYRWAFHLTGGENCGCAGILGKLFHLSKDRERIPPILALIFLTFSTLPWVWRFVRQFRKISLLILVLLMQLNAQSQQTIEILGQIDAYNYNAKTHKPYTNTHLRVAFSAKLSGNSWMIAATNLDDKSSWAQIVYDGTNTYTLNPFPSYLNAGSRPESNLVLATISPTPFYYSSVGDEMGLTAAWLSYGLSPRTVIPNKEGIVDMAVPFGTPRESALAYGFKWIINPTDDGRFAHDLEVVRDKSLDRDNQQELLRPNFDYPSSVGERNEFTESMVYRREIPNGFVQGRYNCTKWYQTNDTLIPAASEFKRYMHPYPSWPAYQATLTTSSIIIRDDLEKLVPSPSALTRVRDYRYKRANKTRIFNFAEYTLQPQDSWKPDNDPSLLALAEYYLKHGRKYDNFGITPKSILVWSLLAALLLPPAIFILKRGRKTQTKTNQI